MLVCRHLATKATLDRPRRGIAPTGRETIQLETPEDPVRCGAAAGDLPPSVDAIGAVGGFNVLTGDQCQQTDRSSGALVQVLVPQLVSQGERVGDQPTEPGRSCPRV